MTTTSIQFAQFIRSARIAFGLFAVTAASFLSSCSTMSSKDFAAKGPTVMNVRSEPGTVQLDRSLKPVENFELLADVKDFDAPVSTVMLRFSQVPISVPMKRIGGTTWRGQLSDQQFQRLAVSGKTIKYEIQVEARDSKGQVATQQKPYTLAIKAPDLSKRG